MDGITAKPGHLFHGGRHFIRARDRLLETALAYVIGDKAEQA